MTPEQKPVHEQVFDLLPELADAYKDAKNSESAELKAKMRIDRVDGEVLSVNSIFSYADLDKIISRRDSANKRLEATLNKICALLPTSMLSEMRNNKKQFSFAAGLTTVTIWFENFVPKVDMKTVGY